jgi:hypothetical protein
MITALLVSVNYADYLDVILPYNTLQFDQIIVLTIESDKECQNICSKYPNIKCLVFPDIILKKNGQKFNKGAILNAGFRYLNEIKYSDWLVMTDSDIIFPENFKELLLSKNKDLNLLYGMKRKHCYDSKTLEEYLKTKRAHVLNRANDPPFIGFCQIFIYQVNKFKFVERFNADKLDIIFLTNFSKELEQFRHVPKFSRKLNITQATKDLPNFVKLSETDFVIHLGKNAKNWEGRITEKFV